MPNTPTTYASDLTYVGVNPEAYQGAGGTPTETLLLTKDPTPSDDLMMLEDVALRQSMAEVYGAVPGPISSNLQIEGNLLADTAGFLFGNILGDYSMTGTTTTPTTTLAATANAGGTSISTTASIPASTTIQIDTGLAAEVFVTGTPSGAGPYTIPLTATSGAQRNGTLALTHASGKTVTAITTPYTYAMALQCAGATPANALQAQAHSLNITDWYGLTASTGARMYPGAMVADMTINFDATKLLNFTAKLNAFGSSPAASTPPVVVSGLAPIAAWNVAVGLGGPASGGSLIGNCENLTLTLTRQLKVYPALGAQQPYIIRQGKFGVTGKMTLLASNEQQLIDYLAGTQRQMQFTFTGGSGATYQKIQFDMQNCYFNKVVPNRADVAVKMDVDFKAIANTTNVGASGGFSPLAVTLGNVVAVGTY